MQVNLRVTYRNQAARRPREIIADFPEIDETFNELVENVLISEEGHKLEVRRKVDGDLIQDHDFTATRENQEWVLRLLSGDRISIHRIPTEKTLKAIDLMASYAALKSVPTMTLIEKAQEFGSGTVQCVHAWPIITNS